MKSEVVLYVSLLIFGSCLRDLAARLFARA
jgi:hypothetical protein